MVPLPGYLMRSTWRAGSCLVATVLPPMSWTLTARGLWCAGHGTRGCPAQPGSSGQKSCLWLIGDRCTGGSRERETGHLLELVAQRQTELGANAVLQVSAEGIGGLQRDGHPAQWEPQRGSGNASGIFSSFSWNHAPLGTLVSPLPGHSQVGIAHLALGRGDEDYDEV